MNYLDKAELARAVRDSQAAGRLTDELGTMILTLCREVTRKYHSKQRDDIPGAITLTVIRHLDRLIPEKVFSWLTSCIRNEVCQRWRNDQSFERLRVEYGDHLEHQRRKKGTRRKRNGFGDTDAFGPW